MKTGVIFGSSAGIAAIGLVTLFVVLGGQSGSSGPVAHAEQSTRTALADAEPSASASLPPGTINPTVEDLHRATIQPAQVEAYERTDIYAKASGFLKTVLVDIGERVQQDQVLAELWIPEMEQELQQKLAAVEQARAAVEQAEARAATAAALVSAAHAGLVEAEAAIAASEAEVEFRRSDYERIAELVRSRSTTEAVADARLKDMRSSEAALAAAQARVNSMAAQVTVAQSREREATADLTHAQAQLKVAEADQAQTAVIMEYAQIRAPYDGLITRRWVDSGDFVTSAAATKTEPLFTMDSVDRLRIVFDVPESESGLVAVGQPAVLKVDALKGRTFQGHVQRTTGSLDPRTRTLRVEVELDGPQPGLKPGMYGMVTVTLADIAQAVVVPTEVIRYHGSTPCVYCMNRGLTERREIEIGYSDQTRTQVIRGLMPQDSVLSEVPGTADDSAQITLQD